MKLLSTLTVAALVCAFAPLGLAKGGDKAAKHDPAARAAKMIEKWDKNGDGKLDAAELTAAFTAMKERREEHRGGKNEPVATTTEKESSQ